MSVDLLVPATHPEAVAGYIIMEVMGYPIYSGSNTLCTATAVLEMGIVPKQEGLQRFKLEAPAGLVQIPKRGCAAGVVESVTCRACPAISTAIAIRFWYRALATSPTRLPTAVASTRWSMPRRWASSWYGTKRPRWRPVPTRSSRPSSPPRVSHYTLGDVGPLPFLHFMGPEEQVAQGYVRSRSATYVHPGVICRSTTGTGTSARLALMHHEGRLAPGDKLEISSR